MEPKIKNGAIFNLAEILYLQQAFWTYCNFPFFTCFWMRPKWTKGYLTKSNHFAIFFRPSNFYEPPPSNSPKSLNQFYLKLVTTNITWQLSINRKSKKYLAPWRHFLLDAFLPENAVKFNFFQKISFSAWFWDQKMMKIGCFNVLWRLWS